MDPQLKTETPLVDGVDLSTVTTKGSTFAVAEIEEDDAYVDVIKQPLNYDLKDLECYLTAENFSALALDMEDVIKLKYGYVKKKVLSSGAGHLVPNNASIKIYYAGFWEKENHPFDWKLKGRPRVFNMGQSEVLPGLEHALTSMEFGEKSIFLLSHHLMYGEQGCPPRIRAKEPCLFYIHLLGLAEAKLIRQSTEGGGLFSEFFKTATHYHVTGKELFEKQNYKYAAQVWSKAADILQNARLANAEEEQKKNLFLTKIYLNIAVCYNKVNLPKLACLACNNLHRLNRLWTNSKALFQNARALIMIEEYASAEKRLKKALILKPNNKEIIDEIKKLNIKLDKQRQRDNSIQTVSIKCEDRQTVSQEFIDTVTKMCEDFSSDPEASRLSLPLGLNEAELNAVCKIGKKFGFSFEQVTPDAKMHLDKEADNEQEGITG